MDRLSTLLARLAADQRGATAIEYCLIGAIISIAIVGGATTIGTKVLGMFGSVNTGFN